MTGEKTRIRLGRETLIGLLGLVGMVCLAVGLTGLSFRSQFLPETVINGVDCTSLDPADAADRLLEQAGRETFSLEDARGEVILMGTLAELADRTALEEELAALQAQQQSERGFFAFLGREDFSLEVPLFAGQDQESLARWLEQRLYGQSPLVEPQDAYLSLEEDFWALVPEVTGNAVDIDKCAGALSALLEPEGHLTDGKEAYTVILSNARILPRVTTENPTLRKRVELLEDLPDGLTRTAGTGMENLLTGNFSAPGIGSLRVCLDPTCPPFLLVTGRDGRNLLLGCRDAAATEDVWSRLLAETGAGG